MTTRVNLTDYTDIGVIGLGQTGLSVARYLLREGFVPFLFDSRSEAAVGDRVQQLEAEFGQSLSAYFGDFQVEQVLGLDALVVSPGIDLRHPVLQMAIDADIPLFGDIDLFAAQVQQPIVGITGSNGKSTVTELTAAIVQAAGQRVAVGGNIGTPVLDLLTTTAAVDVYVLELSSFQLELMAHTELKAATILNFSDDHLDRYASRQDYEKAKQRIYTHAHTAIWNRDQYSTKPVQAVAAEWTFAAHPSEPEAPHIYGLTATQPVHIERAQQPLLASTELQLSGVHNLLNIQAACGLAEALGIDITAAPVLQVIREFSGLPHRCQLIGEFDGVRWINDSKATNIGAAEAAIKGLRPVVSGKLILIAGGDGKGANFSVFKEALNAVDELITIGRDGQRIASVYPHSETHQSAKDLQQAVALAAQVATPGSLVLLAPACASFDMFANYQERGERFMQAVEAYYGAA